MKINDLLTESQKLDELEMPNFATKQGRAINRAEKAGAADVKQSVKDLSVEFASRLGTQGKKFNTATTDDVISFLKSKKVDTSKIDTTAPMDKNRIGLVFNTLVKDKIMGKSIAAQDPSNAPVSDPKVVKSVYATTKAAFSKLNMKEKKRLLTALQKDITSKTKVKKPASTTVDKNFDKNQRLSSFGKTGA
tara:strand:- start:4924 stop:5496 length:573 start_codon:yes stop_codon:yes gene_type:complete